MFVDGNQCHRKSLISLIIIIFLCGSFIFLAGSQQTVHAAIDSNDFSFYQPSCQTQPYPVVKSSKVKNIIFCIGDGMGLGHVNMARVIVGGLDGKLYMERMPVTGIMRTHSLETTITDSAAAATALAVGVKTLNGMISMTPDGENCPTILEAAKNKGLATGLVATSTITHATPAAFAAHVPKRGMEQKIAEHLIENKVDVLLGGGRQYFLPQTSKSSRRDDDKDLIAKAKKNGYSYVENRFQLSNAKGPKLLGLFQDGALTTNSPEPSLAELTKKAIEVLRKDKDGFFLMVEGSQIDWASHSNNPNNMIKQTLLFDQAVKIAIDFALDNKQTLVVVTADHETGGLMTLDGKGKVLSCGWATKGHTGMPVIIYAFGPQAEKFTGVWDNTQIPIKFAGILGIKSFPK